MKDMAFEQTFALYLLASIHGTKKKLNEGHQRSACMAMQQAQSDFNTSMHNNITCTDPMVITVPFPPSLNKCYRSVNNRVLMSKTGRKYREDAIRSIRQQTSVGFGQHKVTVSIGAYMPDARRRDLDNLLKASLDALMKAQVFVDDSQIRMLTIENCGIDRDRPRLEILMQHAS
jgi:crossover junction endodeoxyribonuclease RusA